MPRTRIATVISLAAAVMLLAAGVVVAQGEEAPLGTPKPVEVPDLTMSIVRNELTDRSINQVVEEAATDAFTVIGGELDGKKSHLGSVLRSTPDGVVRAALDAAEAGDILVLMSGGDSQAAANFVGTREYSDSTTFLDIDQPAPCVTLDGRADPTGACEGLSAGALPNYMAVDFDTDQAAYLAGVVAASASREDTLGIVSGTEDCEDCNRTLAGFVEGARSVKPDIEIRLAYLSDEGGAPAFAERSSAATFTQAFIDVYQPDVVLAAAGDASYGIVQAACDAGILAVGTDVDVSKAYPELAGCVLGSITKDIERAVRESIYDYANGTMSREWRLGLADAGVAFTDEWRKVAGIPVGLEDSYATTQQAIIDGQVETCPGDCGSPLDPADLASGSPYEPAASAAPAG
jgi:basic membrane lipoprotein Med (substrate-binding protein (PBP1-ABC) superfamily)